MPTVPFASLLGRGARASLGGARHAPPREAARGAASPEKVAAPAGPGEPLQRSAVGRKQDEERDGPGDDDEGAAAAGCGVRADEHDVLDPLARHAAHLAPPGAVTAPPEHAAATANEPTRARSLEELLPALVRRIAWAGDRHKGTVRLELGAGAHAGTTVTVHADAGRVRVELGGTEGPELERLRARLDTRLRAHGLDVESVS